MSDARELLTPRVKTILAHVAGRRDAYTPDALRAEGVPAPLIDVMVVRDGAPLERARVGLTSRRRVVTNRYVWGPDVASMLRGWE